MKNKRTLLWLLPLSLLLLSGCDCCPMGKDDPLATEILDVRVEPNPVPAGSTTTFTVVTPDSLDMDLLYRWRLPEGFVDTTVHRYVWTASAEPGEYHLSVLVSREGTYTPNGRSFTVTVIE